MKTKAEIIAELAQKKGLPRIIKAALEGDYQLACDVLSSGEETLESCDADGKTLMEYVNELGLWQFLHMAANQLPKVFADVVITEPANLVAWMYEDREISPILLRMVSWEVLRETMVGEEPALKVLGWLDGLGDAILFAIIGHRWQPSVDMLDHLDGDQAEELAGYARREDIFAARLGRDAQILDFDVVDNLVGEVKVVFDAYQHFNHAESYMVVEHVDKLYVVYGDFDGYSPGDIFTLVSRTTYQTAEQSAYAW